jgi:hypothetical protein
LDTGLIKDGFVEADPRMILIDEYLSHLTDAPSSLNPEAFGVN